MSDIYNRKGAGLWIYFQYKSINAAKIAEIQSRLPVKMNIGPSDQTDFAKALNEAYSI